MELWVRTQDKKRILQTTYCGYDFSESEQRWYVYSYPNGKIGSYNSETRCLEIIDEIQKLLMGGNPENAFIALKDCFYEDYDEIKQIIERARENKFIAVGGGVDIEFMQPNVLVYEMPQE